MNMLKNIVGLIGLTAMLGLSNAAYAVCSFNPSVPSGFSAPDGVSDLSGQGNFTCAEFIGSKGLPMTEVTGVVFQRNGDWELPQSEWDIDPNGFVKNTPDQIVEFPQGNGSRCNFSYYRNNAVKGTGLDIDGNVDTNDSIACTDGLVNVEEVILPEPDIVITGDNCVVSLSEDGNNITNQFEVFTGTNIDGTKNAICSAKGTPQNECVRGCPDFIDIDALQANNICLPDPITGLIPLYEGTQRCTPCLTAADAEATIPGFDTGTDENGVDLKLCWEYVNRVNEDDATPNLPVPLGFYKPHKQVRDQTTQTVLFNECYTTTTTVNFFGREITKTVTTCD